MQHHFFVLTCGEATTFDVLNSIKKNIPGTYYLTIWYDSRGKEDSAFYSRLKKYTDDIIFLSKNHGPWGAYSFAFLYIHADFVWIINSDAQLLTNTFSEVTRTFENVQNVVLVGGIRANDFKEKMWISNLDRLPDEVIVINRRLINEIGGLCPSFRGYGHETLEFSLRAIEKGFDVVALSGLFTELGGGHEARKGNPQRETEIARNSKLIQITNSLRKYGYHWWANNLLEKD